MNLLGARGAEEPTVYLKVKDIKVNAPFWKSYLKWFLNYRYTLLSVSTDKRKTKLQRSLDAKDMKN